MGPIPVCVFLCQKDRDYLPGFAEPNVPAGKFHERNWYIFMFRESQEYLRRLYPAC
jgi:hypothetical protein